VAPQEVRRSAGWTGGSLEATATSVARAFSQMFDPLTLSAETVEAFTTPWDGEPTGYGLGISRGETEGYVTYSHGGGVPGFRSDAVYVPELGLTLAVSANLVEVNPDIGALSDAVLAVVTKAVADAIDG
jgi:CubicO group peptidase (beta-lactamase class C family)